MDVEKTIEFILEQQAQFAVRMDRVEGQIEVLTREQMALIVAVREQQGHITVLMGALAMLTQQVGALTGQVAALTERVDALTQRVDAVTLRVDTLARMFEEWLRRSGDGSRPT